MTVIDCQAHWYPPAYIAAQLRRDRFPRWRRDGDAYVFEPTARESYRYGPAAFDLDRQFAILGEAGIDTMISSPALVGDLTDLEPAEGRDLCLQLNEQLAGEQRARPGRFHGLAVLPLQDPDLAVEVLRDAIVRLNLRGVLVHSNVDGGSVAARELLPVYAEMERLGVPLFLHPTRAFADPRVAAFDLEQPLSYMFDTTVAALSLILSGLLDELPELQVVHPHLGGTLPYLVDRVDAYRRLGRFPLERHPREYLSRFHTDTVSESPGALRMAVELYGVERLLFATDHPYFVAADGIAYVREHVAAEDLDAVLAGNAQRLLGLAVPTEDAAR